MKKRIMYGVANFLRRETLQPVLRCEAFQPVFWREHRQHFIGTEFGHEGNRCSWYWIPGEPIREIVQRCQLQA